MDHGSHGTDQLQPDGTNKAPEKGHGGWKHWGLMILCCLPMIAVFLLTAFGVWNR